MGGCKLDSLYLLARETMYMPVPLAISTEIKKTPPSALAGPYKRWQETLKLSQECPISLS
jgi:hypothetical protein